MKYLPLIICLLGLAIYWAFSPAARAERAAKVGYAAFCVGLLAVLWGWKV